MHICWRHCKANSNIEATSHGLQSTVSYTRNMFRTKLPLATSTKLAVSNNNPPHTSKNQSLLGLRGFMCTKLRMTYASCWCLLFTSFKELWNVNVDSGVKTKNLVIHPVSHLDITGGKSVNCMHTINFVEDKGDFLFCSGEQCFAIILRKQRSFLWVWGRSYIKEKVKRFRKFDFLNAFVHWCIDKFEKPTNQITVLQITILGLNQC